ncbi:MAG: DUF4249 domain-containing protein [Bacteroidota bacterium]
MIRKFYSRSTAVPLSGMILFIFLSLVLTSCEKVITLDLNEAEKKYVIEAVITDQPSTAKVLLTQTKNFDEDNIFPGVTGATVTISESGGATTALVESSPGVYINPLLTGISGRTYDLSVNINGQVFTSSCIMPQKVNLDTIFASNEFLFTDTRKIVNVEYKDPAGRGNNYRFVQYVNNYKQEEIFVQNDDYTDGRNVNTKLFFFAEDDDTVSTINSLDKVRIEMLCIDQPVYKYWFSLARSSVGGNQQATPSNPVSNIKGGALGYFSAHTLQTKEIVVP